MSSPSRSEHTGSRSSFRGHRRDEPQNSVPPQHATVGSAASCLGNWPDVGSSGAALNLPSLGPMYGSHGFNPAARLTRLQGVELLPGDAKSAKDEAAPQGSWPGSSRQVHGAHAFPGQHAVTLPYAHSTAAATLQTPFLNCGQSSQLLPSQLQFQPMSQPMQQPLTSAFGQLPQPPLEQVPYPSSSFGQQPQLHQQQIHAQQRQAESPFGQMATQRQAASPFGQQPFHSPYQSAFAQHTPHQSNLPPSQHSQTQELFPQQQFQQQQVSSPFVQLPLPHQPSPWQLPLPHTPPPMFGQQPSGAYSQQFPSQLPMPVPVSGLHELYTQEVAEGLRSADGNGTRPAQREPKAPKHTRDNPKLRTPDQILADLPQAVRPCLPH